MVKVLMLTAHDVCSLSRDVKNYNKMDLTNGREQNNRIPLNYYN